MITADSIHPIMAILKKEVRRLKTPAVGLIAQQTQDPFRVLISCLLSLRTRDETTEAASARLFQLAAAPSRMLGLRADQIESAIYPVSFYRNKARQILGICRDLMEKFDGHVPDSIDVLLTLPGVGRKTANLVVTVAFRKPGICVDTHVHRISNRIGYIRTKSPEESETALREKLPKRYWMIYNDLLVPYGQFICKPFSPICSRCEISPYCKQIGVEKKR
ncbi:MAG: endonuclease III [Candidatus Manganitrophus sp. SA1]|nr:endonuclease III [Candidatus Manganitrophus morganii]